MALEHALNMRHQEMQWLKDNMAEVTRRYGGRWIAIEGLEVIADAEGEIQADEAASSKGVRYPFVVRIPPEDELWIMA